MRYMAKIPVAHKKFVTFLLVVIIGLLVIIGGMIVVNKGESSFLFGAKAAAPLTCNLSGPAYVITWNLMTYCSTANFYPSLTTEVYQLNPDGTRSLLYLSGTGMLQNCSSYVRFDKAGTYKIICALSAADGTKCDSGNPKGPRCGGNSTLTVYAIDKCWNNAGSLGGPQCSSNVQCCSGYCDFNKTGKCQAKP